MKESRTILYHESSKKNSERYDAIDEANGDIASIYIRKKAFGGGPPPARIEVVINAVSGGD